MITFFATLPYPLRVAVMLIPIAFLIRTIKNVKKEGKFLLPFAICFAIGSVVCIVFTSATEFAKGSRLEDISAYVYFVWLTIFFVILFASSIVKYKRGEIPEKRLQVIRSFIIPIIVLLIGAVFSFIMAAVKS